MAKLLDFIAEPHALSDSVLSDDQVRITDIPIVVSDVTLVPYCCDVLWLD